MNPARYILGLRKLAFVRDVLTIQAGSMVLMVAGFASSIVFARLLGVETYGLYAVVLAFAGTFSAFFNIGQGQSLYVFFSEAYGKKDRRGQATVLANFITVAAANVILLCILAAIMPLLAKQFYGSRAIGDYARILCFFQISEIWNSMTLIILQSVRRIRLKVLLEQSANLSFLGLAIVTLLLGGKMWSLLLVQLGVSLVFLPISLITLSIIARKHQLPGIRETLRIPFRESKQYLVQGLIITADKTIGNFFPQGLFFALSLFVPASFIGIARIAVQLANIPRSLLLPQVADLSTTVFAAMKTQGVTVMRKNAAKLMKHAFLFHAVVTVSAMLVGPFLIHIVYGLTYADVIPLTLWLLLIQIVQPLFLINSPLLRLYRQTMVSIFVNILSWGIMITTVIIFAAKLAPDVIFLISYVIFQACQAVITWYVFYRVIPKKDALTPVTVSA